MKMSILLMISFIGLFIMLPGRVAAQNVDSTAVQGGGDVVELGVTEIKIKVETPQVKLFTSRIKPEFDDVHLDKSFMKEITGLGEGFELKNIVPVTGDTRIDVNKVLKKLR